MTLPMARPQKHPHSGVYWLRKRVPDDLRQLVGKREEKRSLGTRNPEEAKRRHAEVLSEIEAQWANLRRGARSLTPEEIESVAALLCSYYVARFGNRGADNVRVALESQGGDTLWSKGNLAELLEDLPPTNWLLRPVDRDGSATRARDARVAELADAYLRKQGLAVDAYSRSRLVEGMANAMEYGSQIVLLDDPDACVFSPLPRWAARIAYPGRQSGHVANRVADRSHPLPNRKQVPFDKLFAGWVAEKQPREKTKYAWRRVLEQLGKFLGHSDASLVSADDLIRWKASLLEAELRASRSAMESSPRSEPFSNGQLITGGFLKIRPSGLRSTSGASLPIRNAAILTTKRARSSRPHARKRMRFAGGSPGFVLIPEREFPKSVSFASRMWCNRMQFDACTLPPRPVP
jgi:hypothetical protein